MKRVIRKSREIASGELRDLIQTVLVAELLAPSEVLWVVSPWVSDVNAIRSEDGRFSTLLPQVENRDARLSEVLAAIATAGTTIVFATRPDPLNETFRTNIRNTPIPDGQLIECLDPALHEKTLTGDGYVLTGSMNFTRAGLDYNEEQITFDDDPRVVAEFRGALRARWGPK